MRYTLFMILMLVSVFGFGQNVKLGLRSGVSFSNFYSHHSPGEIPDYTITSNPSVPIIINPNIQNIPSYHYKTDFIQNMRVGLFSYLYMDYEIKQRLSAEIGLGYTQRGIDMEYNLRSTSTDSDHNTVKLFYQFERNLRLDYISIPLTVQYKLDRKERFYVMAGIYNSVATNFEIKESLVTTNQQTFDSNGVYLSSSQSEIWTPDAYANRFDTGLLAGFGINLPLANNISLGIDLRSAVGLIKVPKKYDEYGFQSFSATTRNISFETGLKLQYILK